MAVLRHHSPDGPHAPFGKYSHAVEIPAGARLLMCSGQLGITAEDEIPDDVEVQAVLCFEAIGRFLAAADMDFSNLVRVNAYVTDRAFMQPYMRARDRYVASPPPASTLMIVSGFTRPEFKVEVEIVAAK
ncbi:MAG: RidA family protein [Pseudolabrys sp.]|jgi:enamine deaminase RidA (YjgF/YER057c/UK114 family)